MTPETIEWVNSYVLPFLNYLGITNITSYDKLPKHQQQEMISVLKQHKMI